MQIGAFTSYFDVAQITLYGFWVFFAGLVLYLHREGKREGYPLINETKRSRTVIEGFPPTPPIKEFILGEHGMHETRALERPLAAVPIGNFPGAPLQPTGNPMIDGVGPAAWAMRTNEPDVGFDDRKPKIVPLRVAKDFWIATEDPNPIGMPAVGADNVVGGTVVDIWVDRSEVLVRYLEVALQDGSRNVLVPMNLSRVRPGVRPQVRVKSILGSQFAAVPATRNPDQVTLLEEDMIMAYYGGGTMYAKPSRLGPLL